MPAISPPSRGTQSFRSVLAAFRSHDNSWWGSRPISLVLRKPHTSPDWAAAAAAAGATDAAAAVHGQLHGAGGGHRTEEGRVGGRRRGPGAVQEGEAAGGAAEGGGVPRAKRAVKRVGARKGKAAPEAGQAGEPEGTD